MKAALQRIAPTIPAVAQVQVAQGAPQSVSSSFGANAQFVPPLGVVGRTLANAPEVWGWRRDRWDVQTRSTAGYDAIIGGVLVFPVLSFGLCGLHFEFDGSAFEIAFAGTNVSIVALADGQFLTPRHITRQISAGVEGGLLSQPNAMVRIDLPGPARLRRLSVYASSSQGPVALAFPPGTRVAPWDRSGEPAFAAMTDSYGQAGDRVWGVGGPYFRAASSLALPHLGLNAIGGTGYGVNNGNAETRDPSRVFESRLPSLTGAQPDLVLTAGGVNDNSWLSAPPTFQTAEDARANFARVVPSYYRTLRAALPASVLAAVGPWTPPLDPTPPEFVQAKLDVIRGGLEGAGGPWILLDNITGQWRNSSGAMSAAENRRWQTGRGYEGSPVNDGGNSNLYISPDGTHPNEAGSEYLAGRVAEALRAAILAL